MGHVSGAIVHRVSDTQFRIQESLLRSTGERYREGVLRNERIRAPRDPHQVYLSVRYTYRMSQIPYSVGVVLPKTLRTAVSRSESVV
jgi:hypothetical protein